VSKLVACLNQVRWSRCGQLKLKNRYFLIFFP